jgi:hypothetical protein
MRYMHILLGTEVLGESSVSSSPIALYLHDWPTEKAREFIVSLVTWYLISMQWVCIIDLRIMSHFSWLKPENGC